MTTTSARLVLKSIADLDDRELEGVLLAARNVGLRHGRQAAIEAARSAAYGAGAGVAGGLASGLGLAQWIEGGALVALQAEACLVGLAFIAVALHFRALGRAALDRGVAIQPAIENLEAEIKRREQRTP